MDALRSGWCALGLPDLVQAVGCCARSSVARKSLLIFTTSMFWEMTYFVACRRANAALSLTCLILVWLSNSGVVIGAEPVRGDTIPRVESPTPLTGCEPCDDGLTGDWGGRRRALAQKGLEISLENIGDLFFIRQGDNRETTYSNLFSAGFTFDMQKLANLKGGTARVWVVDTHGDNPADVIGSIHAPSSIAAADAVRLLEAWYEQAFDDDRLGVLVGFYAVDSEFDFKSTFDIFVGGGFGTGLDLSESGLNGPSIFPVTSFGTRIRYAFSESLTGRVAMLDGVPGNPDDPTATAVFDFSSDQGILVIGELEWTNAPGSRFGRYALGAWHYTTTFDDILDTEMDGTPVQRKGSSGVYGYAETALFSTPADPEHGLFGVVRAGVADQNVQQVAGFYGAGLVYRGLLSARYQDSLGIGFSTAVNGDDYKQAQALAGAPVTNSETEVVLVYAARIKRWLQVQPALQYYINPGTDPSADNALLFGVRIGIIL
jgi:porin